MNNERIYYSHDGEVQAARDRTVLALVFLMLGLGVGAGLSLLFTPMSGKKVRDGLSQTLEQGLKDTREKVEPMVEHVEKELGALKKNVEERLK